MSREFIQAGPQIPHPYDGDPLLRHYLRFRLPDSVFAEVEPGLRQFATRLHTEVGEWAACAEANPPTLSCFSPWGERIDEISVNPAWVQLDRLSAEEGLVAIGYERKQGEFSRLHQFAKLFLFHPSSAFYSCPLAMTDGAARVLEIYGDEAQKKGPLQNLTTRNPARFWTSGQWMTERTGGSDVSGTSTVAVAANGGYLLHGDKWFTSATTAQMALTLARIEDNPQSGLSLFLVELRNSDGRLQGIQVQRLKEKLGTDALPTAELSLHGAPARLVGGAGNGVRKIAAMLNITRLYNSVCAAGAMARAVQLAKSYAQKRVAFGKPLSEQPLHTRTLAGLQAEQEACLHFTLHMSWWLGRDEVGAASEDERKLLRLLTPVLKAWTGKQAVCICSEVLESIGGAAYIEDTGLPRLLRDAQVFPIWEGTTNVLSLDMLRALQKENSLPVFSADVEARLQGVKSQVLRKDVTLVREALAALLRAFQNAQQAGENAVLAHARDLALSMARVFSASLLLQFADWCEAQQMRSASRAVAQEFISRGLCVGVVRHDQLPVSLDLWLWEI